MIFGVGTDICSIPRIRLAYDRHGEHFARRILTKYEIYEWQLRRARCENRALAYLASRFSAKEAIGKALGLGIRYPMSWQNCAVLNKEKHNKKPVVLLLGPLRSWCTQQELRILISLSDERDAVVSFCIVERK